MILFSSRARLSECWVLWSLVGLEPAGKKYPRRFLQVGRLIKKAYPRHSQSREKGGIAKLGIELNFKVSIRFKGKPKKKVNLGN